MSASVLVGYATRYGHVGSGRGSRGDAARTWACGRYSAYAGGADPRSVPRGRAGGTTLHVPLAQGRAPFPGAAPGSPHAAASVVLGPFHADGKEFQEVREQLEKELAKFPWLIPAAIAIFGGKFDPQKLTFPHNLVPALKNMPASDVRDWTAIRAWASNLATQLRPAVS